MSLSIKEFNNYLEKGISKSSFTLLEENPTLELNSSFIKFSLELKFLYCSTCSIPIASSYISLYNHFKNRHVSYLNTNKKNIKKIIEELLNREFNSKEDLKDI